MIEISSLQKPVRVLLFLFLLIAGLIYAKPFLVPLVFAALLAMLFLPISRWMERKGIHRAVASIICVLILGAIVVAIVWLFAWQMSDLGKDADKIEQNLTKKMKEFGQFIGKTFNISEQKQQEILKKQQESTTGKLGSSIGQLLAGIGGFFSSFFIGISLHFSFFILSLALKKVCIAIS